MKKYLVMILMIPFGSAFGQSNTFPPSGRVGIGTISPEAKLSFNNVDDGSNLPDGITWYNGAPLNYGIYRSGGSWTPPSYQQLRLQWDTGIVLDPGTLHGKCYVEIQGNGLRVLTGNVGIGIVNPTEKLSVNGNIRAREIKVETTGWPDYVFDPAFELPSLESTEKYIQLNGHLPGMPSAREVAVNGLSLGELNKNLLKQVEEITLHLIAQNKVLLQQNEQCKQQSLQLDKQDDEIELLKKSIAKLLEK